MKYNANEIKKIIEENINDFNEFGIRIDDRDFNNGDALPNSYIWIDNEKTDDELNGTCSVLVATNAFINGVELKDVITALEMINDYYGKNVYLIGGSSAENGEDYRELIIQNAKVIKKLN